MTERLDAVPPEIANAGVRSLLKALLPAFVVSIVHDCRGMPAPVALTYVRLRALRRLGLRSDRAKLRRRPRSLLFVCHGNVMRSPVAAELVRARLGPASPQFAIASAGTWTTNGRPADPRATAVATDLGISLDSHRSQILTKLMIERSDLICVMDFRNEAELVARFPRAARKTVLLGGVERHPIGGPAIPDPYMLDADAVSAIYRRVARAVDALVSRLRPPSDK
jgi:protein-tyrosine phosphatase